MMDEVLPLIAAATCVMALMLTATLLVRRQMRRGEIVQVTVRRVDLDDSAPDFPVAVTLTYAFPWQGQTLEICQPPRRGILPPQEGERREMRWDPISRRLRELPSGRCGRNFRAMSAGRTATEIPSMCLSTAVFGAAGPTVWRSAAGSGPTTPAKPSPSTGTNGTAAWCRPQKGTAPRGRRFDWGPGYENILLSGVTSGETALLLRAMKSEMAVTVWACCSSAEIAAGRSPFCGP